MSTTDVDDAIRAFIKADREVLTRRAQNVEMLADYLLCVDGWKREDEAERKQFAGRTYFQRWRVRQGVLSDEFPRPEVPS